MEGWTLRGMRARGLATLLAIGILLAACATPSTPAPTQLPAAPSPTPQPRGPAIMRSPDYGVQVFLWGSPHLERDLRLAKEAGFTWIKQMFQWNYMEGQGKGKLEWNEPDRIVKAATQAGLKVLARVDIAPVWARDKSTDLKVSGPPKSNEDFGEFIFALVDRYKPGSPYGEIHAFQIWNEPNLAYEWGGQPPDPVAYTRLLKVAYEAAKRANPDAVVIAAGLSPTTARGRIAMPDTEFLKTMYDAGAKGYFDVLGAHAAGYRAPPELSPDEIAGDLRYNHNEPGAGRIYGFRHVEDLRKIMVDNGDSAKRVAVLEFGWTSDSRPDSPYKWHSVSEDEKAAYAVRAFRYAKENWAPWVGVMTLIYIADPLWTEKNEQYYWAITKPDGSLRPAYLAIQQMPK